MDMKTGNIHQLSEEEHEKLLKEKYRDRTPLTEEEQAALAPMNRKERRAALVQMRKAKKRT